MSSIRIVNEYYAYYNIDTGDIHPGKMYSLEQANKNLGFMQEMWKHQGTWEVRKYLVLEVDKGFVAE